MDQPNHRTPLSVADAARLMGVCRQTVRNRFEAFELEGYRVGRKILVYADSVEEFKLRNSNQRPAPAEPVAQRRGRA